MKRNRQKITNRKPGPVPIKSEYKIVARGRTSAEIMVYGVIGADMFEDGVSAKQFDKDLKSLGNVKNIDLRINSDGGVVTEARAMYNMIVKHSAHVTAHIEGIAASAASFLAMAADKITIGEGDLFMIHNARVSAFGKTAGELRKLAGTVETIDKTITDTYVARTGQSEAKVRAWMKAETFFSGTEAHELGFADELLLNRQAVTACADLTKYGNLPKSHRVNRSKVLDMINRRKS